MCSIIITLDKNKCKELVEINQFRGNFSYSITEVDSNNIVVNQVKEFGLFNTDNFNENSNLKICHVQAPTGGLIKDINRIHPVKIDNAYLWHNGMLTARGIKQLQNKLDTTETFDTKLILEAILKFGFDVLNELEGSFACVLLIRGEIYLFRARHSKIYVELPSFNVSSEKFENSKCINYDTIYSYSNGQLTAVNYFKTLRYNIVVEGEM